MARQTAHYTEDQLADYGHAEMTKLENIYGASLTERLQQAALMINHLEAKQPGVKALLKQRGVGDSARVVSLILDQSERYWARRR